MPEITKNQLKHIRLLKQKKYRQQHAEFVVEGEKNIIELLKSAFAIKAIFATEEWKRPHLEMNVTPITQKQLSQISSLSTPDKVIAIAKIPKTTTELKFNSAITLCLDSINDPGNLGTIIRTADWFGIKNIVCSANSVDCYNPKVVQATKGSIFNINVTYTSLEDVFTSHNIHVYGAALNGKEINTKFSPETPCFLLMGSESHGISPILESFVTHALKIPQIGKAESLNVAIATSILLHQFTIK